MHADTTVLQGSEFVVATRFFLSDDEPVNFTNGTSRLMVKFSVSDPDVDALLNKSSTDVAADFDFAEAASGLVRAIVRGPDLIGVPINKGQEVKVYLQHEAVTESGSQYRSRILELTLVETLIKS